MIATYSGDTFYCSLFEAANIESDSGVVNPELEEDVHIILLNYETMKIADDVYFLLEE